MMHHHAVQHAASAASELGLGFTDKRNRNPNWTDHEIIRFLDILQEEKVLKDLMAQRNKQVTDITMSAKNIATLQSKNECNKQYNAIFLFNIRIQNAKLYILHKKCNIRVQNERNIRVQK